MKILLAHNFYGSAAPSGENMVYLAERALLQQKGHVVLEFTRHSDELRNRGAIGAVKGAVSAPWNPSSVRKLRDILDREKPHILHAHNTFPLLSPAIFRASRGFDTATVLTLHNYRTFCAGGIPMRNNVPCTECLDKRSVLPALKYGCYRNSKLATIPMVTMIALHRRTETWYRDIDAFIVLTEFQKERLSDAGLPQTRVHIKPHFYADPPVPLPWQDREPKVVFIGRLGPEKGVHVLLEAWKEWGNTAPSLEVIGDGPDRVALQESVKGTEIEQRVSLRGQLPFSETQSLLARARLLVLPSLCFECFPMVIREAFALGVPVAGSRLGAIPYIVADGENGVLFAPGDSSDLYRVVTKAWDTPGELSALGEEAREEFDRKYTADMNYEQLISIYEAARINRRRKRPSNVDVWGADCPN